MTEALPLVDAALRGAFVATALLLGTALMRDHRGHPVRRVGASLMAGLIVQSFATLPWVQQGWPIVWQAPLVGLSVGNSVLFWLFARALFDDDFSLDAVALGWWLGVVGIGAGFACPSVNSARGRSRRWRSGWHCAGCRRCSRCW